MINLGIIVALLTTLSGKENLGNSFTAQSVNKFVKIVKSTVVKNAFNKQCITDILLF